RAIQELVEGPKIQALEIGLVLMVIAGVVNGAVGLYLVRAGRAGSVTLVADGMHLLSDAVTSIAVVIALIAVKLTGWRYIDPLAAMAVAVYLAVLAIRLLRQSVAGLMDEQDVADEKMLRALLDSHLAP